MKVYEILADWAGSDIFLTIDEIVPQLVAENTANCDNIICVFERNTVDYTCFIII